MSHLLRIMIVALLGSELIGVTWSQSEMDKAKPTKPSNPRPNIPNPNIPGGPPGKSNQGPKTPNPNNPGGPPHKSATAKTHKVTGDIFKVDCAAMKITIGTQEFLINNATHITKTGKKARCADLKDGDKVTASYTTKDDKKVVKYISVR